VTTGEIVLGILIGVVAGVLSGLFGYRGEREVLVRAAELLQ